jgi:hypothetical protein
VQPNRRFGSILNNDMNNILYVLSGIHTTPEQYKKAVLHLLDTKPGVLAQNVGGPDPVLYRSEVATVLDTYLEEARAAVWGSRVPDDENEARAFRALLDAGTDPLAITIEACRERGVPIVASYRMNAEDFYHGELDTYDFGRTHKHLRIPGANCLDPAHLEVFEHRMAIFAEVVESYDVDGIEFDFRRWTHMVSDPLENHPVLTRMVRETSEMLARVAADKGRDGFLLGARVAPTIDGPSLGRDDMSCRELGLDVETWVRDGLVDYICPSFFWGYNPGDDPHTAEFVTLTRGTDAGVYPTVFPCSKWQKESPEAERIDVDDTEKLRRFRDDVVNAALICYEQGADGISTFNWVPHHQPGMTPRNLRESWGLGSAKVQMHVHPLLPDPDALRDYLASDVILPSA